jgi:hypothetical protein
MNDTKIVRTICYFSDSPTAEQVEKVQAVAKLLEEKEYLIQTRRFCTTLDKLTELQTVTADTIDYRSAGAVTYDDALELLPSFFKDNGLTFNIDLAKEDIEAKHAELLYKIIAEKPSKTFNFTYTFNNALSSPYFPSGTYAQNGFAIGLQPTNLAKNCKTLDEWLHAMQNSWQEITGLFSNDPEFLGIDSSIAPIGGGDGSFVYFLNRLGIDFSHSTTTDMYIKITRFIKEKNPKPTGLCGMMLPCLEDDDLAVEYDKGNFSIERNVFLSLHSGLGIDTYPIGVDEDPARIVEILKLIQALSNKYQKPLSARFISDGKSKVGDKTDFQNQYLADCTIRAL